MVFRTYSISWRDGFLLTIIKDVRSRSPGESDNEDANQKGGAGSKEIANEECRG